MDSTLQKDSGHKKSIKTLNTPGISATGGNIILKKTSINHRLTTYSKHFKEILIFLITKIKL